MKRLFSFFLCLMICILNISSLPAARASAAVVRSKINFKNHSPVKRIGDDWTTLSPDDLWHAWDAEYAVARLHGLNAEDVQNCEGCIILNSRYTASDTTGYIVCIAVPEGCSDFMINDYNKLSISYTSAAPRSSECITYNVSDNIIKGKSYFTANGNPMFYPYTSDPSVVNYLTEIVYSDYDIKNSNGDLIYQSANQDLTTNDDWFSVSCNPSLSADMDLTSSYTNSKGQQVTTADYSLDVIVKKTGEIFSDNEYGNRLYSKAQCFCFVSTEPVNNRDYTAALNSCTYLHYEKTQYISDLTVQPNNVLENGYDSTVSQKENMLRYFNYMKSGGDAHAFYTNKAVVDYSEVFGFVPYKVFDSSVSAEFTIDLNGVPLEAGQTYYFNVIAVPLNTMYCRNLDYKPIVNQTALSHDGTSSLEWGDYSPLQYMQNLEDISECHYSCKSIPFSFSNLACYDFTDKSDEFGIDPYTYSDDNLKTDNFDSTVEKRDDLTFKDGSIDSIVQHKSIIGEWSDIGSFGGSGSASSGIMATFKSIIPFFRLSILAFPENMQGTVSMLIMLPFVFLLIAVIIAGIKFLISLFSG